MPADGQCRRSTEGSRYRLQLIILSSTTYFLLHKHMRVSYNLVGDVDPCLSSGLDNDFVIQ